MPFLWPPPPVASPVWCVDADVNVTGSVNVSDAQLAINYVLKGQNWPICDVNLDAKCTVADVQQIIMAITTCPDVATWYFDFWACEDTCDWARLRTPIGTGEFAYVGHHWVLENLGPYCNLVAYTIEGTPVTDGANFWLSSEHWGLMWEELYSQPEGCALEFSF